MQGTQFGSLGQEDLPGRSATKPVPYNCGARVSQQKKPPQWEAPAPQRESSPRSSRLEKNLCAAMMSQHSLNKHILKKNFEWLKF